MSNRSLLLPCLAAAILAFASAVRAIPSTYTNPVIARNFPDPCVLPDHGDIYAYATNAHGETIPCAHSTDLVHWSEDIDAMPSLPPWAEKGHSWAPDVAEISPGHYVMYF